MAGIQLSAEEYAESHIPYSIWKLKEEHIPPLNSQDDKNIQLEKEVW